MNISHSSNITTPAIARINRTETPSDGEKLNKLPIRFRTSSLCHASECLLTSLDMHRRARPIRPLIFVNPRVIVGKLFSKTQLITTATILCTMILYFGALYNHGI